MPSDRQTDGDEHSDRHLSIVETMADGVFVLDPDDTIVFVNDAIDSFLEMDGESLVGESFRRLASEIFDEPDRERFATVLDALREDAETDERRLTVETPAGRILELRLCARRNDASGTEIVGTTREVTERERALEAIERQQTAIYRLYEVDVDSDLTVEEKIRRGLEIGCEFLDLPIGFLASVDGEVHRLDHIVGTDTYAAASTRPLESTYCRLTVESDDPVAIRDAATDLGTDDPAYVQTGMSCYIGTKIPVNGELYGTFCFAAADARDRSFTTGEREFVRLLGLWAGHKLERQRFETVLRGLHGAGQKLLLTETKADVAEIGVEAVAELFDLPITACWRYDEATDSLRPLAETAASRRTVGETPAFERGDALVWESFDSGTIRTYEALAEETGTYNPETPIDSEIHVPLGKQGVLASGSTDGETFEHVDFDSLRLLGDLLRDALIDVEQQETLEERGEALQRQNEQLQEFAHVVAHDLRNPLAGAVGFLEIARETNDEQHFDRIDTSLDRMQELIEELLEIAKGSRQAVDPRDLSLGEIVREAWSYLDAEAATLSVPDDLGRIYADETRLLQLFGNLFRNSVEHAGSDVTVEVGRLDADGGARSGRGFYVEDDGPGLPPEVRQDVLTLGKTNSAAGTGIGMDSVTDIVEAHGWTLSIPESDGGARFEIRTDGIQQEEGE
jgi:PAS domain S-box-containing protein